MSNDILITFDSNVEEIPTKVKKCIKLHIFSSYSSTFTYRSTVGGLPLSRMQSPPPNTIQDKTWTKDTDIQKHPLRIYREIMRCWGLRPKKTLN